MLCVFVFTMGHCPLSCSRFVRRSHFLAVAPLNILKGIASWPPTWRAHWGEGANGQDRPTWAKMWPRWGQDGPTWGQDRPTWAKMWPRWGQDGPRWGQDGGQDEPRWGQYGLRWRVKGQISAIEWNTEGVQGGALRKIGVSAGGKCTRHTGKLWLSRSIKRRFGANCCQGSQGLDCRVQRKGGFRSLLEFLVKALVFYSKSFSFGFLAPFGPLVFFLTRSASSI